MASEDIVVAVGSTNKVKIAAAREGFFQAFRTVSGFTFKGVSAPSQVADQPMDEETTRRGAANRCLAAARLVPEATYSVGLEGGCSEETVEYPGGKVVKELVCFAYMAVWHRPSGRWGYSRTASFALPPAVAALVRSGVELGVADDMIFKREGSKEQDGAVGLLTKGVITRTTYYSHALVLALIPFVQPEHYSAAAEGSGAGAAPTEAAEGSTA